MSEKKNPQLTTEQLVQIAEAVTECKNVLEKIGVTVCISMDVNSYSPGVSVFLPCKSGVDFVQALPVVCEHSMHHEFGTVPTNVFTYGNVQGVKFDVLDNLTAAK